MTARPAITVVPAPVPKSAPFRLLGFINGEYFYLSEASGTVVCLTASEHTEMNLQRLATDDYWLQVAPGKHGPNFKWAGKDLIASQHQSGFFDASKMRGAGCWLEGSTVVFHAGDRLYVNGVETQLHAHQSQFVYPRRKAIAISLATPATTEDGEMLSELCSLLPWVHPNRFWHLPGFLMCAMVCGALPWRPHAWLSGGSGVGKSWTFTEIVQRILGPLAVNGQSSTTEAGIRQTLGCDALAIDLDEMEGKDEFSIRRHRAIFELSRQSSSETGAPIIKGSSSGEAVSYRVRSSFFFSSIADGATEQADENRICRLEYVGHLPDDGGASFKRLTEFWQTCVGLEDFCDRIRARAITMAPVIREAYEVFRPIITRLSKSSRCGQQMGAISAGYWCLLHDTPPSVTSAELWCQGQQWVDPSTPIEADENRVLDILLQSQIPIESEDNLRMKRSISEALWMVYNRDGVLSGCAKEALDRHGIRPVANTVHIANKHVELSKIFKGSQYDGKWSQYLLRLPGAVRDKSHNSTLRKSLSTTAIHIDTIGIAKLQPELPVT